MDVVTYGLGGYDPAKPASNVVSTVTVTVPPETLNADTLAQRAAQAIAANVTYLAIAAPTTAQITAQVARLTRETTALLRMHLGAYEDTSGA